MTHQALKNVYGNQNCNSVTVADGDHDGTPEDVSWFPHSSPSTDDEQAGWR
ncbi:hypothetical protein AB0B48_19610 [Micromonospora sp. NPDC049089]|uniref:hypothetical protein n=1 Tax=unclassified Micromonospora TaxID=2617518 RepID=UPI0034098881